MSLAATIFNLFAKFDDESSACAAQPPSSNTTVSNIPDYY